MGACSDERGFESLGLLGAQSVRSRLHSSTGGRESGPVRLFVHAVCGDLRDVRTREIDGRVPV
jgi:hypothetical protein